MRTSSILFIGFAATATVIFTLNKPDLVITYGSPEERILRYVSKMETNKMHPKWQDSEAVRKVKRGNALDEEKVRQVFADQEILTNEVFDVALTNLRSHDLITKNGLLPTSKGLTTYETIKLQYLIDTTPPPDTNATTSVIIQ